MDDRSPERGSRRGPESGSVPQAPKTRRELRAEREAAERAATGEHPTRPGEREAAERAPAGEHPTRPGQPAAAPPGRPGPVARHNPPPTPRPWTTPEPHSWQRPERPPYNPSPPVPSPQPVAPQPPSSPRPPSRRDRSARLPPSADEDRYDADLYKEDEDNEDERDHAPHKPVDRRKRRRNGIWLTIIALLLGLWTATMFLDSTSPLIAAPSALMPLVTICALPVIAISVGGRHFVSTAIAAVAALLPWVLVAGYASAREAPVGKTVMVRVLSVEGALGQANATSIAAAARTYAADVVVITGLNSTLAHALTVAGLDRQLPPVWARVANNQNTGIGIYSRLTISHLTSVRGFSKPAAAGVLEAGPARVGLTVAQMPGGALLPGAGRSADLKKLAGQKVVGASSGSVIVGALNTSPWQPGFRALEKAGWEDAADVAGKGLRPTWPSWSPLPVSPVDHVLVDREVGVTSTATVNIGGSSHRALVVTLEVPAG